MLFLVYDLCLCRVFLPSLFFLDSIFYIKNIAVHHVTCSRLQILYEETKWEYLLSFKPFEYKTAKCTLFHVNIFTHSNIYCSSSVKPRLSVRSSSLHRELAHEVRKGCDTVPQFRVLLLSQWDSSVTRGAICSHDARQAKEHLGTNATPALQSTEKRL